MGATVFAIVMLGALFWGVVCLIVGITFLRDHKNRVVKVISIIICTVGVVLLIFPVGWIIMLRIANGTVDEDYVDTGTMIVWDAYDTFTYKDQKYVCLDMNTEVYWYDTSDEMQYTPAFNIRNKSDLLSIVFNAYDKDVMYEVENGTGETIYYNGSLYCEEESIDKIKDYYSNNDNFTWYIVDETYENKIEIELSNTELNYLNNMSIEQSDITWNSEDYYPHGYIQKRSKDQVVYGSIDVIKLEDAWCWSSDEFVETDEEVYEYEYLSVRLPESIHDKIEKARERLKN